MWRRCCWYYIAGAILSGFTAIAVEKLVPEGPRRNIPAIVAVFGTIVAVFFVLQGWRLRVDSAGISHRLLFGWGLWSRADLASGRVRKISSYTLCDPRRPFWSRYLCFDFLAPEDRQEVMDEINKHYQLPPPPPAPEKLELRYAFRKVLSLEKSSIQLKHGHAVRDLAWSDVQDIHICRSDPVRRDFCSLAISLPGEDIELKFIKGVPTWKGAETESITEFLMHCPARERIFVSMATKERTRVIDAERDLKAMRRMWWEYKMVFWFYSLLLTAMFIWFFLKVGIAGTLIFWGVMAVIYGPAVYLAYRLLRKQLDDALERVALLKGEPRPPA